MRKKRKKQKGGQNNARNKNSGHGTMKEKKSDVACEFIAPFDNTIWIESGESIKYGKLFRPYKADSLRL